MCLWRFGAAVELMDCRALQGRWDKCTRMRANHCGVRTCPRFCIIDIVLQSNKGNVTPLSGEIRQHELFTWWLIVIGWQEHLLHCYSAHEKKSWSWADGGRAKGLQARGLSDGKISSGTFSLSGEEQALGAMGNTITTSVRQKTATSKTITVN